MEVSSLSAGGSFLATQNEAEPAVIFTPCILWHQNEGSRSADYRAAGCGDSSPVSRGTGLTVCFCAESVCRTSAGPQGWRVEFSRKDRGPGGGRGGGGGRDDFRGGDRGGGGGGGMRSEMKCAYNSAANLPFVFDMLFPCLLSCALHTGPFFLTYIRKYPYLQACR